MTETQTVGMDVTPNAKLKLVTLALALPQSAPSSVVIQRGYRLSSVMMETQPMEMDVHQDA